MIFAFALDQIIGMRVQIELWMDYFDVRRRRDRETERERGVSDRLQKLTAWMVSSLCVRCSMIAVSR